MRSVLVIAYLFPPLGGPGVQRTLGFVRHLPAQGWRPWVVAAEAPSYWARDESLLARVPTEAVVRRVSEGWMARGYASLRRVLPRSARGLVDAALLVPDRQLPWLPAAVRAATEVSRTARPEVIFATGAPWTNLLVGALVAARTGCPLVTDFRDPWTDSTVFTPASGLHRRLHRALEAQVHRSAAHVLANTEGNLHEMQESFPETVGKSSFIPNGWDPLDFEALPVLPPDRLGLRLGYAGNFYAGRRPDDVLGLLAEACRCSASVANRLRLRFVGHTDAAEAARIHGLSDRLEEMGYRPLAEALGALSSCDVTLVTVPPDARRGWVPQKLYQQLRLGRPVLTLAPAGDAADLTRTAGQLWVDPAAAGAGQRLAEALEAVLAKRVPTPPPEIVARYDRTTLAAKLAARLEAVSG